MFSLENINNISQWKHCISITTIKNEINVSSKNMFIQRINSPLNYIEIYEQVHPTQYHIDYSYIRLFLKQNFIKIHKINEKSIMYLLIDY